jgi:hypothetical protein
MTYSSTGAKPTEYASKANHHYVINDEQVKSLIDKLHIPPTSSLQDLKDSAIPFTPTKTTISDIFAIDGGYTQTPLVEGFPASSIHFFQFGAVHFTLEALKKIELSRHPDPDDMSKLKNIDRVKFPLPTLNTRRSDCDSLLNSVRLTLHEFLANERLGESMSLLDTLSWFLFRQYKGKLRSEHEASYEISSNPFGEGKITLRESEMKKGYTFASPETGKEFFLIDAFRLHEQIDEQSGAVGICGYVAGVVEHLILLHLVRNLMNFDGGLSRSLLIMDRPTGFFGNTSRLIVPMMDLTNWLFDQGKLYLAGLEKSGAFVEHARQIKSIMPPSSYIVLGNSHIYKYVSPPTANMSAPYASTSYYGHKVIFKTGQGQMYVVSLPTRKLKVEPTTDDIPYLLDVLTHIEQLKCDMYENALLPVALANKLVSLAAVPSSKILESFAKSSITK